MRALVAALGDAPWEEDVPIVQHMRDELRCEEALGYRAMATWALGDLGIREGQHTTLQYQLEQAQREIDRYC